MSADALVVTGPTASGKTALSIRVALRLDGEIVSMDSRQVYRGMNIGTAKATPEERAAVAHHGLDLVDPDQRYSAGAFARDARRWIAEIRSRGRVPVLVGGTGFFLRALTRPLFNEPELPRERRERLDSFLKSRPGAELERWLEVLDPETARSLRGRAGGAGRQRVLRALEIVLLTGRPLPWWHAHAPPAETPLRPLVFVLDLPRDQLYARIDARVHAMIEAGLVEEVARLLRAGYDTGDPGMNATGYPEIVKHLRGEWSLEDAVDAIQRATRRYARRQLTWFRHQLPADAVWLDATRPVCELEEEIVQRWHANDR